MNPSFECKQLGKLVKRFLPGPLYESSFSLGGRHSWTTAVTWVFKIQFRQMGNFSLLTNSTFSTSCMIPNQLNTMIPTISKYPLVSPPKKLVLQLLRSFFHGLLAFILFACKSFKQCPHKLQNEKAMQSFVR